MHTKYTRLNPTPIFPTEHSHIVTMQAVTCGHSDTFSGCLLIKGLNCVHDALTVHGGLVKDKMAVMVSDDGENESD